jgi:hypothetical protein
MIFFLKKTFFVYSFVVVICGFHFDIEFSLNQQWQSLKCYRSFPSRSTMIVPMTLNYVCSHGVQLFELTVLIYISLTSNQNDSTQYNSMQMTFNKNRLNLLMIFFFKEDVFCLLFCCCYLWSSFMRGFFINGYWLGFSTSK